MAGAAASHTQSPQSDAMPGENVADIPPPERHAMQSSGKVEENASRGVVKEDATLAL